MGYNNHHYLDSYWIDDTKVFFIDSKKERIDDLKEHRDILKEDLEQLNQSLNIIKRTGKYVPNWQREMEIISPNEITLPEFVINHAEKDFPNLSDKIKECVTKINDNNINIQNFQYQIQSIVEKQCVKRDILITEIPNRGFYFGDGYITTLDMQLNSIFDVLCYNSSFIGEFLEQFRPRVTINEFGFIQISDRIHGNGDRLLAEKIEDMIHDIPKSRDILLPFSNIVDTYLSIQQLSDEIHIEVNKIIDDIHRNKYKTRAKCCPKRLVFI